MIGCRGKQDGPALAVTPEEDALYLKLVAQPQETPLWDNAKQFQNPINAIHQDAVLQLMHIFSQFETQPDRTFVDSQIQLQISKAPPSVVQSNLDRTQKLEKTSEPAPEPPPKKKQKSEPAKTELVEATQKKIEQKVKDLTKADLEIELDEQSEAGYTPKPHRSLKKRVQIEEKPEILEKPAPEPPKPAEPPAPAPDALENPQPPRSEKKKKRIKAQEEEAQPTTCAQEKDAFQLSNMLQFARQASNQPQIAILRLNSPPSEVIQNKPSPQLQQRTFPADPQLEADPFVLSTRESENPLPAQLRSQTQRDALVAARVALSQRRPAEISPYKPSRQPVAVVTERSEALKQLQQQILQLNSVMQKPEPIQSPAIERIEPKKPAEVKKAQKIKVILSPGVLRLESGSGVFFCGLLKENFEYRNHSLIIKCKGSRRECLVKFKDQDGAKWAAIQKLLK